MRRWRKMTWVLWGWTILMLVWIVAGGISATNGDCDGESTAELRQLCEDATDVGAGIGIVALFVLWFVGFIVLSLVWLMTRPRREQA